jgi:hypothetical protein
MRWPALFSRRQRAAGRHAMPVRRPGSWAEIALPPPAAPAPIVPDPQPAPSLPSVRPKVRLGFTDGTQVEVPDTSGEFRALRALADRIIDRAG